MYTTRKNLFDRRLFLKHSIMGLTAASIGTLACRRVQAALPNAPTLYAYDFITLPSTEDVTHQLNLLIAEANRHSEINIVFEPRTYLISASLSPFTSDKLSIQCSQATFAIQDGSIVNSDTVFNKNVTIFDFRGPSYLWLNEGNFDGNRNNQAYPATKNNIRLGTGKNGYRDNALVRVTPRNESLPAMDITINLCNFTNAYLSGLALVDVEVAKVLGCDFEFCTWNGITAASACSLTVFQCAFNKCGAHTAWNTTRVTGDRGGVQVRCRPSNWTSVTQGYPILNTLRPNGTIKITSNIFNECGVIGIYGRSVENLTVKGNTFSDTGYQVHSTFAYRPASIWYEWILAASIEGNTVKNTYLKELTPDGIVGLLMEDGPGSETGAFADDPVPFYSNIQGSALHLNNRIFHSDPQLGSSSNIQSFLRGYRVNSGNTISGGVVKHCLQSAVYATNSGSFSGRRLNSVTVENIAIERCRRIFELEQYTKGYVTTLFGNTDFLLRNITFAKMIDLGTSAQDGVLITTASSLLDVCVQANIENCSGDGIDVVTGRKFQLMRLRGNNSSELSIKGLSISNYSTGIEVYNFSSCSIENCIVDSATGKKGLLNGDNIVVFKGEFGGGQNSGRLNVCNVKADGLVSTPIVLKPGSVTLAHLDLNTVTVSSPNVVQFITGYNPMSCLDRTESDVTVLPNIYR